MTMNERGDRTYEIGVAAYFPEPCAHGLRNIEKKSKKRDRKRRIAAVKGNEK